MNWNNEDHNKIKFHKHSRKNRKYNYCKKIERYFYECKLRKKNKYKKSKYRKSNKKFKKITIIKIIRILLKKKEIIIQHIQVFFQIIISFKYKIQYINTNNKINNVNIKIFRRFYQYNK